MIRTLRDLNYSGKRVIVRMDVNVPFAKGHISDDYRIRQSIPTLQHLLKRGAKLVLIAHRGRPHGEERGLTLEPVAKRLATLIKKKIFFAKSIPEAKILIHSLKKGEIIFLENIRFFPGEVENSAKLAKTLASLGDVYVNDAFGDAHRAHASIAGIPKYLPSAAGLLLQKEIEALHKASIKPKRPLLAIIGGAKIGSKVPLIEQYLKTADAVIVGGAIANTILAAKHIVVGKSLVEHEVDISWLDLTSTKLHLPIDALITHSLKKGQKKFIRAIGDIKNHEYIADIGPDSIVLFESIIKKAKTIIWNGPLGFIEIPIYAKGTEAVAKSIASSKAFSVIGGGDLHIIIRRLKLEHKMDHVSTGGGAMLEFLSGKKLPGIEALKK